MSFHSGINLKNIIVNLFCFRNTELSKLAESFLGVKLTRTEKTPKSEPSPVNYHNKSMAIKKIQKIQELLNDYPIQRVRRTESFISTKVSSKNMDPLSRLSLPVIGAKLGGISSGQPIVTKEVNVSHDSNSIFATTKASDDNKIPPSSYKNMYNVTQSLKGYSDSVSKVKVAHTYEDILQSGAVIQDTSDVSSVEEITDNSLDPRFQHNATNFGSNEYIQPVVLAQNSPLTNLSSIVTSMPDTENNKISFIKDSKSVLNSDKTKVKDNVSGVTTSKLTFGNEDQSKSDLLTSSSPKIIFGSVDDKKVEDSSSKLNFSVNNSSQNFFKNKSPSSEMSKNFFNNSASPFKSVFAGAPVIKEMPVLNVSKTSTDIKVPKGVLGTSPGAKSVFGFIQTVPTEPVPTDSRIAIPKNIFVTKTTMDVPKSTLSQPATVTSENVKILTPVENSKISTNVFNMTGNTAKDTLSTPAEFKMNFSEQTFVKHADNEVEGVKSPFVSKPAVEPAKLIFSSSAGNSNNSEHLGTSQIVFSGVSSFQKSVSVTTATSPVATTEDFVVPQNPNISDGETDNTHISSITSQLSSSVIQEEADNEEEQNVVKDKIENVGKSEEQNTTLPQDTSLPLFDSLSLEQNPSPRADNFSAELHDNSENQNQINTENQNISPVKTTSGSVPSITSSFSPLLSMQNTSVSNTSNSSAVDAVSSPSVIFSKAETKTVSSTSNIFNKPDSSVASTVAEKPPTTQAASTFSFSLPAATGGVSQSSFTFSLPASSPDKASTFRFAQADTTVTSNVTTSSTFSFAQADTTVAPNVTTSNTFSFGQLASTVTTTAASDKNTKITLSFGNQTAVSTSAPIFSGFTASQTVAQSSLFGQPVTTTSANTVPETCFQFTISTTTPPQNSFFGSKANLFGTATTATTASNMFGQPMSSPSSTASSPFGQTTSVFGQATSSTSPFGPSVFNTKAPFGQSGGSLFGQTSR